MNYGLIWAHEAFGVYIVFWNKTPKNRIQNLLPCFEKVVDVYEDQAS